MAVSTTTEVSYRRFQGYSTPQYPTGYWYARQAQLGDATGGTQSVIFQFVPATATQLNSNMFSLEEISATASNNVTAYAGVVSHNLDSFGLPTGANAKGVWLYQVGTSTFPVIGSSLFARDAAALVPWFLGSQRLTGMMTGLEFATPNVNLSLLTVYAQGYIWGPRSVLADGGPQRPPNRLYL